MSQNSQFPIDLSSCSKVLVQYGTGCDKHSCIYSALVTSPFGTWCAWRYIQKKYALTGSSY